MCDDSQSVYVGPGHLRIYCTGGYQAGGMLGLVYCRVTPTAPQYAANKIQFPAQTMPSHFNAHHSYGLWILLCFAISRFETSVRYVAHVVLQFYPSFWALFALKLTRARSHAHIDCNTAAQFMRCAGPGMGGRLYSTMPVRRALGRQNRRYENTTTMQPSARTHAHVEEHRN